jgi:hypothetical protein
MIQVPSNSPKTVSFTQAVTNQTAEIAKSQVLKAALAETTARGELDNANYRLAKATETLRVSEIAYRESVTKSVWNKEELRKSYNNAIAEYRDADKNHQAASEAFNLAKGVLAGLRKASGVAGAQLGVDDSSDSSEDYSESAYESGVMDKFLDDPSHGVAKRDFSSDKRQELASKGKAMTDGSYPIETRADLANAVQSYGRAKDPKAVKAHIITQAKALGATDALPDSWQAEPSLSTAVPTNKSVLRKDASMPTDSNGYTYAADLGAPMGANQTNADFDAQYDVILCPDCLGFDGNEGCPTCGGLDMIGIEKAYTPSASNRFGTDELLTRPFQKSVGYQEYIFSVEKYGVKGRSGAQPGHPFEGNQHTGGMRTFSRGEMAGKREGWKQTVSRYQGAHDTHLANGRKAVAEAKALEAAGKLHDAAAKHEEAAGHFQKAHGALKGIQNTYQKETDRGSRDASQAKVAEFSDKARSLYNGEKAQAEGEVVRLNDAAYAADTAAAAGR